MYVKNIIYGHSLISQNVDMHVNVCMTSLSRDGRIDDGYMLPRFQRKIGGKGGSAHILHLSKQFVDFFTDIEGHLSSSVFIEAGRSPRSLARCLEVGE